jgi:pentatricopeptide repeat protein
MLKSTMLSAGAGGESLEAGLRVVEEMRVNNVRPDKETLRTP